MKHLIEQEQIVAGVTREDKKGEWFAVVELVSD
jgi:hypothetical protein